MRSVVRAALLLAIAAGCAAEGEAEAGYTPRYRSTVCRWQTDPAISCGFLDVPERRDAPEGRQVAVYVERVAARKPASETLAPILYLHGGPGSPPSSRSFLDSPLRDQHEIVLMSQRGVGYSEPKLACGEIDEWSEVAVAFGTGDPRVVEGAVAAAAECRRRLADRGIDLSAYDTLQAAHDIEDLRIALDIADWSLLGSSYGTRLALEVMRAHPDGVRSVVLAGTLPPQVDFFAELPQLAERALRKVFDACVEDPGCPTPGGFDDLERIAGEYDERPRDIEVVDDFDETLTHAVRVDGGKIGRLLFGALYDTDGITWMPALLSQIESDPSIVAGSYVGGFDVLTLTPSAGLRLSIDCREQIPYTERERTQDVPSSLRAFSLDAKAIDEQCAVWDVGVAPASSRAKVESAIPTLLVVGELDPITPPEWTALAAESLSHAHVVEVPGAGHDALHAPCAESLMETFLSEGRLAEGAGCPPGEPLDFGE